MGRLHDQLQQLDVQVLKEELVNKSAPPNKVIGGIEALAIAYGVYDWFQGFGLSTLLLAVGSSVATNQLLNRTDLLEQLKASTCNYTGSQEEDPRQAALEQLKSLVEQVNNNKKEE